MSDQVELEEKTTVPSNVDSVDAPQTVDESSKTSDKQASTSNSSDIIENGHLEKQCTEQSIADGNTMDVIDEPKNASIGESVEIPEKRPVEMEIVSSELTAEQKDTPIVDAVTSNDSVCIDIAAKNDVSVENQESLIQANAIAIDIEAKPQKTQTATPAIGSLGLLNQYASSSDEDEDSSESGSDSSSCSSSDSADSDTETESDDEDEDDEPKAIENNVEMANASSAATENQLDAMANNILASVMSRNDYRDASSDTSDTDSDDSDIECLGSVPAPSIDITNEEEIQEFLDSCEAGQAPGPVKAKGEFTIDDLPPIDELTITVPESECVELGKVSGIVGTLVLVESLPNFAAVDIDTVLFLDKGNRTLGQVFDVMGNVASPIYCVRFNTVEDITAKDIKAGLHVYVAPQTEYTNFIVLTDLMKQRGCDASWENDHEAPDGLEFSDDEEERLARRAHNQRQHNRNRTTSTSNESVPNKVVKNEVNTPQKTAHQNRRPKHEHRAANANKPPTRFYKDNRGYANANPEANLYQHQQQRQFHHPNQFHHRHQQQQQMQMQQQHHQQMQAMHHNYSWHTAAAAGMHPGMPSTSAVNSPAMPYVQSPFVASANGAGSTIYPNPFALQANALNYGPFNLQAFPPLPPPMSQLPPPPSQQQHHRQPGGRFNRKNANNPYQNHQQ